VPSDGDTSYVYGDEAGQDSYATEDLPLPEVGEQWRIHCITVKTRARTLIDGEGQIQGLIRTGGGADDLGVAEDLMASYAAYDWTWDADPDTGGRWQAGDVDALEHGTRVTST
jgi:hypothetical protein